MTPNPCPFVPGSRPRAQIHRGGARVRPGAAAPRGADPRGPAHRLRAALEPHRVDEILGHPKPALPHVPQETTAGGGRGVWGWIHRAPRGGAGAPDRGCLCLGLAGLVISPQQAAQSSFLSSQSPHGLCWVHGSCKEQLSPWEGMQRQPCQDSSWRSWSSAPEGPGWGWRSL